MTFPQFSALFWLIFVGFIEPDSAGDYIFIVLCFTWALGVLLYEGLRWARDKG